MKAKVNDLPFWEKERGEGPLTEELESKARLAQEMIERKAGRKVVLQHYEGKGSTVDVVDGPSICLTSPALGGNW